MKVIAPLEKGDNRSLTEGFDIQATIQLDSLLSKENVIKSEPMLMYGLWFIFWRKMDKLALSALKYSELLGYEYIVVLGRKGKTRKIRIIFS